MNTLTANTQVIVKKVEIKKEVKPQKNKEVEKARRYLLHKSGAPVGFSFQNKDF